MKEKNQNRSLSSFILWTLILVTVGIAFIFARDMSKLNAAYADIMNVEAISSTTQRQINLASVEAPQQREVFVINDNTVNALSINGSDRISLMDDSNIAVLANEVLQQWLLIEEIISVNWNLEEGESAKEINLITLGLARDGHFKAMTDLSKGMATYTNNLNSQISKYQFAIMSLLFFIGLILFNNALQTRAELVISRELSEKAQIDTATGLYNRSRCQELFKGSQSISDLRKPAIMVLDLNDLKKTNDNLGHRVGDELIYTFANILKNACAVHTIPPFIGRYGGDEFIIYYEDIQSEAELQIYLNELVFLTKAQNENETRFQVSYAVGYSCVCEAPSEKLTARQLFDKADEAMYVNKEEGKRARNANYDAEKMKGETR